MKKPNSYLYPAVFTYEDGQISVTWPDLPGCTTCGNTDVEALKNAREAMSGHLYCMEEDEDMIPKAASLNDLKLEANERTVLVDVFMPDVRAAKKR